MASVRLKYGRDKSVLNRHPWIFSGAVDQVLGDPASGETVSIISSEGKRLGFGAYSPHSQIRVRVWSFDPEEEISESFFRNKIERCIQSRQRLSQITSGYRLIYSESDGLPGIIADVYDGFIVCQFLSAGSDYWKNDITRILEELMPAAGIYERSDADSRIKEGLIPKTGVLRGDHPPDSVTIQENGMQFIVDICSGHKTGFYLDQRDNRSMVLEFSEKAEVLNCFSYTGGFSAFALKGGASRVMNLDSSSAVLNLAQKNMNANGFDPSKSQYVEGDVFHLLRKYRDSRRQFDLIILDPPKFADSKNQLEKAARGYKDINLLAFKLLRTGGILFTFSCSGMVSAELFQKIVADAALDADKDVQILRRLTQGSDHPTALNFPEGSYLKGFICRVV